MFLKKSKLNIYDHILQYNRSFLNFTFVGYFYIRIQLGINQFYLQSKNVQIFWKNDEKILFQFFFLIFPFHTRFLYRSFCCDKNIQDDFRSRFSQKNPSLCRLYRYRKKTYEYPKLLNSYIVNLVTVLRKTCCT